MKKLWLTYAWIDNKQSDVDHVIDELRKVGLDVHFDRRRIVVGQRLWPQIDKFITDPEQTDAWAIFVTEHSLASEPCKEELAYALGRALGARGAGFPLTGIFPAPLDPKLIPSALSARKYVNLNDPNWAQDVLAGVNKTSVEPNLGEVPTVVLKVHELKGGEKAVEMRPRSGRWYPFRIQVPASELAKLGSVCSGPKDILPKAVMCPISDCQTPEGDWKGVDLHQATMCRQARLRISRPCRARSGLGRGQQGSYSSLLFPRLRLPDVGRMPRAARSTSRANNSQEIFEGHARGGNRKLETLVPSVPGMKVGQLGIGESRADISSR